MVTDADVGTALRQERIRLHGKVLPTSLVTSAAFGTMLAAVLWTTPRRDAMAGWLMALVLALATRAAVGLAQRRDAQAPARAAAWLLRHRLAFLLHGAVWVSLPMHQRAGLPPGALELMVFASAAITAGSFINIAFDLVAAWCFAALPLLGLLFGLLQDSGSLGMAFWLLAIVFVAIAGIGARRSQRMMGEAVHMRLAAQGRADEARQSADRADRAFRQLADQHQLMTQLLQTTRQGFWFVDNEGRTTDLNPAMAQLLGRRREEVIGHRAQEYFTAEDRQSFEAELASNAEGRSGAYEVGLLRADGTPAHCVCQASPIRDADGALVGAVGIWTDITVRRQAETILRGYELVVNSITDMVSVVDTSERYMLVNDAWCRIVGVSREAALGSISSVAAPTTVSSERRRALRECVASGEVRRARGHGIAAGSAERLMETTYYPHRGDDGQVQFVAMVTRDITEAEQQRAALEAREAAQRALLEAFPGHIARLDTELVITFANQRLAALLGRPAEAVTGLSVAQVLGPARAEQARSAVARALAGEPVDVEYHHRRQDGAPTIDLQVTLVRGTDPQSGASAIYAFAIDISARKRAEEALIAARDEAESANRAKSEFLSHMSHELRTPMNAILGFGQLLHSDGRQPLAPHQQAWVLEILRGAEHLLELINEILDLGRIESGELVLRPEAVGLHELVLECLGLMQPLASERQVRLLPLPAAFGSASLMADRRRLKQVLLNLLANAIKYNRREGQVALEYRDEGHSRWLAVRDSGPGLTAAEQARLFQPFERLAAARSGVEGTGIGLALCRRLVLAMGGSIGVDSQSGAGSTFWLRLPASAAAQAMASPPVPALPMSDAPLRTVLYIEDNQVNVLLMEAMLARLPGVRLLSALHPTDGLRLARQELPALVLLDVQLPDIDGFGVLLRLRADPTTAQVPVVAVSANALQRDIDAALAAGFDGYLTKPVVLDELLATVQRALEPAGRR